MYTLPLSHITDLLLIFYRHYLLRKTGNRSIDVCLAFIVPRVGKDQRKQYNKSVHYTFFQMATMGKSVL